MKCKICGKRMKLDKEEKYEIYNVPQGLKCLTEKTVIYECFDCPKCGCQNIINIREINRVVGE